MNKKILLLLSTVIWDAYQPTFAAQDSTSEWNEDHDGKVLQTLIDKNIIPNSVIKKKAIVPDIGTASKASRILFIKTNNDSYVVKETDRDPQEYKREKKLIKKQTLSAWKQIINQYQRNHKEIKLPELIDYYSAFEMPMENNSLYITVMSKAKGDSLLDINKRIESSPHQFVEKDVVEIGAQIGQQMGALSRAFFEANGSILLHGDAGSQNFLYDAKHQKFYWIDLGGTTERKYKNADERKKDFEFGSYAVDETDIVKTIWWSLFPFNRSNEFESFWDSGAQDFSSLREEVEKHGLEVLKSHRLGILAGNAFYNSYREQVKDLAPAKEWETNKDSFVQIIQVLTGLYKQSVLNAFGEDKGKEVLEYLFAPAIEEKKSIDDNSSHPRITINFHDDTQENSSAIPGISEIEHQSQEENLRDLSDAIVRRLNLKIIHDATYRNNNPFRRIFAHNDYSLTTPQHYIKNLEILNTESAKRSMREVIDSIVLEEKQKIKNEVSHIASYKGLINKKEIEIDLISEIKERLFSKVYGRLISEQQSALDLAKRGKIYRF